MGNNEVPRDAIALLNQRIMDLEYKLTYDAMTGIYSKQAFYEHFTTTAKSGDTILFIDLDDFKSVNDNYGHAVGDNLLIKIANAIHEAVEQKGIVARLAGDEFVVLLHDLDEGQVGQVNADIIKMIGGCAIAVGELNVSRRASIGCAQVIEGMQPHDGVIAADRALRVAKRTGKNRAVVLKERHQQLQLPPPTVEEVRLGLSRSEIGYFVQPIFDLERSAVWGYEALLRWQRPNGEIIGPAQFLATMTNAYVYDAKPPLEAAHATAAWVALKQDKHIAFNISTAFLKRVSEQGLDWVQLIVGTIPMERVVFEIVETVVGEEPDTIAGVVGSLRECGVKVALDDFGIGESTLSRLQTIPVDYVKVDRHFLAAAMQTQRDRDILFRMIDLVRASHAKPVVEGIETDEQLSLVRETGADLGQGFLLGCPNPISHWETGPPTMRSTRGA